MTKNKIIDADQERAKTEQKITFLGPKLLKRLTIIDKICKNPGFDAMVIR